MGQSERGRGGEGGKCYGEFGMVGSLGMEVEKAADARCGQRVGSVIDDNDGRCQWRLSVEWRRLWEIVCESD